VTNRKKKILSLQILIFLVASLLIYFTYYNKGEKKLKTAAVNSIKKENEKGKSPKLDNTNTFENVEYKGIDLNGNRYTIKSEIANFDLETPEIINMKIMSAIFYFKDGTILKVKGDYGVYNNKTNDMKFRENIIAKYTDNYLYADNLDYLNTKNLLTIYGNVKTESIKGNIVADKVKFDLESQTVNMSMFDKNKVEVKIRKE
tara:strand:+ start:2104 stop:2709 length:606 start_codon:yes stop_codon:yes gene_type:complete